MYCVVCGWQAFCKYYTYLYGVAPVCSCCIVNSRILHRGKAVEKESK